MVEHVRGAAQSERMNLSRRDRKKTSGEVEEGGWTLERAELSSFQPESMQSNAVVLSKCISLIAVFGGLTVGIGFTDTRWIGLAYVLPIVVSLIVVSVLGRSGSHHRYSFHGQPLSKLVFQNLMAYVMFWTLASNMCHVFF